MFRRMALVLSLIAAASSSAPALATEKSIIVQSTTSTKNSGLYKHLLPLFKQETGITVNVVAVGTGQAIKNAKNCDGDVLLVHARSSEEEFVSEGFGVERKNLMYNDFIIVGPPADGAAISGSKSASAALKKIAGAKAIFASRGDNSGTHSKEMALWKSASIDPSSASGTWYRETGSGMGATLNVAVGMGAYALTDRATWISFKNRQDFEIMVEGDEALFNQYGVIQVNAEKCPNVKQELGQTFVDWLTSSKGQQAIASYKLYGRQLFFPNAAGP